MQQLYILFLILTFLLGLCIGSFLNVVIYRLPQGLSVAKGRSVCPVCGHTIRAYDNIPLCSYLLLRGRCRDCKAHISPRYPLVELLCGVCFLLVASRFGMQPATLLYCAFAACLIAIACIDWDTQEIPDRFHVILLALGIAAIFLMPQIPLTDRLIGMVCVSVPILLIGLLTGGFGMGDAKLMAAAGLLLGWQATLLAGLLGAVIAATVALALIAAKKRTRKDKIAFGPYLSAALFISALYGQSIIDWYIHLFGLA